MQFNKSLHCNHLNVSSLLSAPPFVNQSLYHMHKCKTHVGLDSYKYPRDFVKIIQSSIAVQVHIIQEQYSRPAIMHGKVVALVVIFAAVASALPEPLPEPQPLPQPNPEPQPGYYTPYSSGYYDYYYNNPGLGSYYYNSGLYPYSGFGYNSYGFSGYPYAYNYDPVVRSRYGYVGY